MLALGISAPRKVVQIHFGFDENQVLSAAWHHLVFGVALVVPARTDLAGGWSDEGCRDD